MVLPKKVGAMIGGARNRRQRWRLVAGVVLVGLTALAGCSDKPTGESINKAGVNPAEVEDIAATVPAKIRNAGKLVVGVNVPYAPNEFKEGDKVVGFDVDLMNAVASVLGLKTDYRESDLETIIPSIEGETFDVGMSSFTDTKEREKTVDFVTYFSAGILWAQRPGPPVDPNDACGRKVAVQRGTTEQQTELPAKNDACVTAGEPPIEILQFDSQDSAANAVVQGQADAFSADSPVTAYAIKQSAGKLEAAGAIFDSAPYGWPVKKGSPLAQSLLKALEHLMKTVDYQRITAHWGVEQGMIKGPVINGAIS